MREPAVANSGAHTDAVSANAAMSSPACDTETLSATAISLSRPLTLKKLTATKKLPAISTANRDDGMSYVVAGCRAAASPRYEHASAPTMKMNPTQGMNRGCSSVHAVEPIDAPIEPPR